MDELDRYDDRMLDNREYDGDDVDARLEAERALDNRDIREGRGRSRGRDIVGVAGASESEDRSSDRFLERRKRQRRLDEQASEQVAEEEVRRTILSLLLRSCALLRRRLVRRLLNGRCRF